MTAQRSSKMGVRLLLLLAFLGLFLAACGRDAGEGSLPEGCDGVTWGNGIQVEERPDGYVLIITGDYPDSCSTVCGSEQTVRGNLINVDLFSSRPRDKVCSQILTPFQVEVVLDTEGLEPDEYTITLNKTHAQTTFTLK